MLKFKDINAGTLGDRSVYRAVKARIREKNLNFIVARSQCLNQRQDALGENGLDTYLEEFASCGFSMVSFPGDNPSPPFMATDVDTDTGVARVRFLIDFTQEAETGRASRFYSKIMGAFATQFFAAHAPSRELWFPFTLEDTVGRGLRLEARKPGMAIVRD
ncbi:MAG: hypothetical protein V6Z89_19460 [Desulfobacter sp.]